MAHHGNTPAAWTAVTVAMVGFVVGGIGLMMTPVNMTVFWVAAVITVLALPIFAVMNRMGLGDEAQRSWPDPGPAARRPGALPGQEAGRPARDGRARRRADRSRCTRATRTPRAAGASARCAT